MFCPKCKCEYREGFNSCPDCGNQLVKELHKEEYEEFVTVATTTNVSIIPIVKSILEYADIKYFIKGDMLVNVPGINNVFEVQVLVEAAQDTKDLLKDLDI